MTDFKLPTTSRELEGWVNVAMAKAVDFAAAKPGSPQQKALGEEALGVGLAVLGAALVAQLRQAEALEAIATELIELRRRQEAREALNARNPIRN